MAASADTSPSGLWTGIWLRGGVEEGRQIDRQIDSDRIDRKSDSVCLVTSLTDRH